MTVLRMFSELSPRERRRVRIWAAVVMSVLLLLALQATFAWPLPEASGKMGPAVWLLVFLAALACEYIDSSLGMGYGTTLTPLLLLAGFEPLAIVPCVLFSEFITGICAGAMHHRDGNVDLLGDPEARRTAGWLSILSVVGAVAAVVFALEVPTFWLTAIIAIILLSVGVVTLATSGRQLRYRRGHMIVLGAVAAFNKGLSGGGYGPLVTAGQVVSGVKARHAVAITSMAEALTCLVGLAAYLALRGNLQWTLAVPLTIGALLSVPVATLTVRGLSESVLRRSVGAVTCLLGLLAIVKLLLG